MLRRPHRLVAAVPVFLLLAVDAQADCPGWCYPDTGSGISWYGGTVWDATDARWEALPGGTWTFESGVGSAILADSLNNKLAGLHSIMEGWTGVRAGGPYDWSNIVSRLDLPAPLTSCTCAVQDSVLIFEGLLGTDHESDQDNWAASPWIDLPGGDQGKSGRVLVLDAYYELPYPNYVAIQIRAQWRVGVSLSAWSDLGHIPVQPTPTCSVAGSPYVFDLSGIIPSNAEEIRVGLGVVNFCSLFANCTAVTNFTPVFDNVRFGITDAASRDLDNDGVADAEENAAPGGGDADGDTIQDAQENYVVSLLDSGGSDYAIWKVYSPYHPLQGPGFRCMRAVDASTLPPPPGGATFPSDIFEFTLVGSGDVTVSLPAAGVTGRYFMYGTTAADTTDHWYEFDWDGTTGVFVQNGKLLLRLVDGQRGDDDRTVNGVVVHRGGPGLVPGTPHAAMSTVPNVVYDPAGVLDYDVLVRDENGTPVNGSTVEITFPPAVTAILCTCPSFVNPITAVTDANGVATFTIVAGGCVDPDSVGAYLEVRADGTYLASVGGVSPDAVDDTGRLPWQNWAPGGVCHVALSDAVFHSGQIRTRSYGFCSDIDSDGKISLIDAVLVTGSIKNTSTCP